MTPAVPNCLLQLLRAYTSQALDAAHDVSDEFEGEVDDLTRRATRIHAVLKLIRECEEEFRTHHLRGSPTGTSTTTVSTSREERGANETPLQLALCGLGEMMEELTGVMDVNSRGVRGGSCGRQHYGLRPLARHVSLAEAAMEVVGHSTKVVFRRAEKRERDHNAAVTSTNAIPQQATVFASLSASQRKRRLALYTARLALLPPSIPSPVRPMHESAGAVPLFVSPAVREFALLNVEAECAMLTAFYHTDVKAQLLRELPSLWSSVRQLRESLRMAGVRMRGVNRSCTASDPQDGERREEDEPWYEFPCTEAGVIRIVVRRSLAMEVTWGPPPSGRWRVLTLRWLLRTQTLPELLTDSTPLSPTTLRNNSGPSSSSSAASFSNPGTPLRILPAHYVASVRYLNNHFETGLESGCLAALHLVNAVVMDVIETQCKALSETFFLGPLESSFVVDVHPGTYVAITLQLPSSAIPTTTTRECAAVAVPLHVKYRLCMGTVVVEWRRGTDTRTTLQSDLYSDAHRENDSISTAVIVDVERLLWRLISA